MTNEIDLTQCIIHHMKFGKMDNHQYNIDLFVFSHLLYPIPGYEKAFVCFEINYN